MSRDKFIESSLSTGVGVPDGSGGRSGNRIHRAYQRGGAEYPYDKASGQAKYGVPLGYDRSSSGNGGSRQNVNVPKNVGADDTRWSEVQEGPTDGYQSATPVQGNITYDPREKSRFGEDDVDEAIGVPYNSAKGGQGTGGQTGGRVTPGTSGQWGGRPYGEKWDNSVSDSELDKFARQDEFNYGPIRSLSNGEEEKIPQAPTGDVELGRGAVILKHANAKFGNHGDAMKQSRMNPGLTWRESRHRGLVEAFVSLSDTPQGCPVDSTSAHDIDRDMDGETFRVAHNYGKSKFDSGDESDIVKLMMQIEPNYFAKSLGKIGKDGLMDIYEQWVDEVLSNEDDISKMTERIMMTCGEKR